MNNEIIRHILSFACLSSRHYFSQTCTRYRMFKLEEYVSKNGPSVTRFLYLELKGNTTNLKEAIIACSTDDVDYIKSTKHDLDDFKITPEAFNDLIIQIVGYMKLPGQLYFSQTCTRYRTFKPEVFELEEKCTFENDLLIPHLPSKLCFDHYMLYFKLLNQGLIVYDSFINNYLLLRNNIECSVKDLLPHMLHAARIDDGYFMSVVYYEEDNSSDISDVEYYKMHYQKEGDLLYESIWNVFWDIGGDKVKCYIGS